MLTSKQLDDALALNPWGRCDPPSVPRDRSGRPMDPPCPALKPEEPVVSATAPPESYDANGSPVSDDQLSRDLTEAARDSSLGG